MNSKGKLTPSHAVTVNIRLDLPEVEMMLERIEECDRKYPRIKPQQEAQTNDRA